MKPLESILLISPPGLNVGRNIYHPVGLLSLASCIKKTHGDYIHVEILDLNLELLLKEPISYNELVNKSYELIKKRISAVRSLVGFTTTVNVYPLILDLARLIKKQFPNSIIVFGGAQATLTSKSTLNSYSPLVDYIVSGEGEIAFEKLLGAILAGDKIDSVVSCEVIKNLDILPYQDVSLISLPQYFGMKNFNYKFPIELGRGCIYNCSYCSASLMWGRKCRFKSVNRFTDELQYYTDRHNICSYDFVNDNITNNRNYIINVCKEIRKRKLDVKWECHARMDQLDKRLIEELSSAGCDALFIGMESFSNNVLGCIGKGYNVDCKNMMNTVDALVRNGIRTTVSLMYGFPFEREQDIAENIFRSFQLKAIGVENIIFSIAEPEPATRIFHENKDGIRFYNPPSIPMPFIMDKRVEEMVVKDLDIFSSFFSFLPSMAAHVNLLKIRKRFQLLCDRYPKTIIFLLSMLNVKNNNIVDVLVENKFLWPKEGEGPFLNEFVKDNVVKNAPLLNLIYYEDLIWGSFSAEQELAYDTDDNMYGVGEKYVLDRTVRIMESNLDIEKINESIRHFYNSFEVLDILKCCVEKPNYYLMVSIGGSVQVYNADVDIYRFFKFGVELKNESLDNLLKYKIISKSDHH